MRVLPLFCVLLAACGLVQPPLKPLSDARRQEIANELEAYTRALRSPSPPLRPGEATISIRSCVVSGETGQQSIDCFPWDDGHAYLMDVERLGCYGRHQCVTFPQKDIGGGMVSVAIGRLPVEIEQTGGFAGKVETLIWGIDQENPLLETILSLGCSQERPCWVRRTSREYLRLTDRSGKYFLPVFAHRLFAE